VLNNAAFFISIFKDNQKNEKLIVIKVAIDFYIKFYDL